MCAELGLVFVDYPSNTINDDLAYSVCVRIFHFGPKVVGDAANVPLNVVYG